MKTFYRRSFVWIEVRQALLRQDLVSSHFRGNRFQDEVESMIIDYVSLHQLSTELPRQEDGNALSLEFHRVEYSHFDQGIEQVQIKTDCWRTQRNTWKGLYIGVCPHVIFVSSEDVNGYWCVKEMDVQSM